MSVEDDRAAKAARAKAMLKKRQQKKTAGPVTGASTPVVSPPISRTGTPALPDASIEPSRSDLSEIFSQGSSDTSWLTSLTRAEDTHPPPSIRSPEPKPLVIAPSPLSTSPPVAASVADNSKELEAAIRTRDETIARMKSEQASIGGAYALATTTVEELRVELEKRDQSISELSSAMATSDQEVQRIQRELSDKGKEVSILKSEKASLEAANKDLKGDSDLRAQTIVQLTSDESKLQRAVEEKQRTVEKQTEQLGGLTSELAELTARCEELDQTSENQRGVIQLLVEEKASLTNSIQHLENLESELEERDVQLKSEQEKTRSLDSQVEKLEGDLNATRACVEELHSKEVALSDKSRDQERELQIANGIIQELRSSNENNQRRVSELEEQIQDDDRVEILENSLKHTQERADELEFQVTKLKQAHTTLKTEKDEADALLTTHRAAANEWKAKHAESEKLHAAAQEQLSAASADKDALAAEKATLETTSSSTQKDFAALQAKLSHAASELTAHGKQLQTAQYELKKATRRAEEAEKVQADLQADSSSLLRSLEEMRPKIVELTQTKLELGEKVEDLENTVRERDTVIFQLEDAVHEARDQKEELESQLNDLRSSADKDRSSSQDQSNELQTAYSELSKELKEAQAGTKALSTERDEHLELIARQLEELESLSGSSRKHATELKSLRHELEERKDAQEEEKHFLDRAQTEIEALRIEVSTKEEEIARIQTTVSASGGDRSSLNDEMLSALRQQHALELSGAASKLRAIETSLFEADAKSHSLQKQVSSLEDQIRLTPPRLASRPSSVRSASNNDLRKASYKSSNLALAPSRLAFEENLSPETRHKRQVSLSMLRARIDSEMANVPSRSLTPIPSSRRGSGASSSTAPNRSQLSRHTHHNLQFDESHIFQCHSCRGDIFVL